MLGNYNVTMQRGTLEYTMQCEVYMYMQVKELSKGNSIIYMQKLHRKTTGCPHHRWLP